MSNDKTYFSETVRRSARPRSRRRREQGTGGAVRGYSGGGTTSAAPAPTGHSHTNKELLDSLRTDELNYLYKARVSAGGTEEGRDKIRAGQADTAHDLTPDSPAYNRFLRKDADDKAAGVVDFLKGLRLGGKALTGILTTGDTAGASEANVLSALRALSTFLRKDRPDAMPHLLKLLDGLETGTFAAGRTGGRIDRAGNGELGSLTLRDLLTAVRLIADGVRSKNYTPGDMGTGFGLTTGEGGSLLEVDYLLVRRVATFLELLIREMRHVGGTLVLSGASGKVVRVEDKPSAWRVHFKTREDGTTVAHGFTVGAQARCQTYNRTSGNTYYWRLVTAVGDDWVELSKSDYDKAAPTGTARTVPAVGDELVQLGHRTDTRQTGAIVLDTVGEGAPSIRLLKDIRSYSLTDANVRVLLSPSAVRVIADEVSFASGKSVEETITDSGKKAIEEAKKYFDTQKKGIDNSIGAVSGKVDNLVIGGRNLLKYARLIFIPATYAYGRGSYTTAVDTATLCEGQRSLKVTASKVGSEGGTDNFVWEAWNVVRQSECVTVSFYAKAATAGTRFSVRMGGDVCNFPQTVSLSTDWQRFEMTFREPGRKWTCIVAWFDRPGTVWIALPKMELGSRATDWSLAPEDVYNEAQLKANGVKVELNNSIADAKNAAQNVQTNLDNLTIGGRNLLRYSALEKTPLNNIVYGRKPENAPVGVEEGYQGAKAVKLVFTTPGKPSVSEVMWRTWEERTDHNRVEPVVLRFWAKADKDNTRMWTSLGYHGGKFAYPTISSEWKEYTVNFMPDGPWALWCIGLDAPGTVWISRPKLEYGTKPTDWTPAPEDWVTKINDAKSAGTAAADALEAYKKTVSGTFHDGIIQEAEARAIEKYRNIVNSEFGALTNTYNAINENAYLEGTAKSALANAFNALRAAKDALITSVNNAISDKRVTEGEKQAVDAKYNAYQSAYAAYSAALEVANGSIHAKLKGLADKAANDIQVGGRNLIPDSDNGLLKHFIIHQPNNAPRYSTVDGWWRMAFDRDKQIVSRELTMTSVGTIQGLRKGNLAFSILCRTDGRIVSENLRISFFGGGQHRYVPANIENCGNNTYRIWGVYMNYPVSDLRVPDFMFFSTADATYVEFRYPKLEYGTKPTDWTPAPEDVAAEIAAKTEAARQAAQAEAIGLNKWIAQAYYTGKDNAATPPKLEDIVGKTPTRTVELKDAQFNVPGGSGSVFGMDYYTGIRTTYVYLDADYNLTTGIQHDDAGALYVNGTLIASGGIQASSWKSVTLPLKRGWNRIDGLWNEGGGGDYFKFQAPLENDAHIIQLACRPNVSIDPMRAVTMTTLTKKYSEIVETNESIENRVGKTEESIKEVGDKVKGFTTVDKNGQVLIKPDSVWAGVETKVKQLSDENLAKLSVGGRNLILSSDTSAAPVAMKAPTDGTAYKIFPVKTTLVKHDCQEEEPYTLTVWYTSTSQFPFESFPIGGKPGGDDWSVRFIASEGQITQEGGMKKCVMQAVVPKGGRVLYNPTVGFIYGANSPCNMSLYRVKLERGTKGTDWTPAPEDLPTIDTLSRTGIDIQQGVITLDAQKVKVQNGSQTMAMFEGGKLKAELIDAKRIKANDILSQNIVVGNNATITNLRAKNAVIEGKFEAASGSTIGGMTGYSSYLGFETQRGTASERILHIGTQAIPLSTGFHGMLYLTDKQRDAFKTIVYIESLGKEEKRWNLADARAHNKAIHIASGTLRVDPGNLVDMPGVLLSGRVSETGHVEYEYGRRRMGMGLAAFSVQLHDGRDWVGYTVTHNLGHTNYTVQATPWTPGWNWRKYMMHVDQLTANYFTLLCIDTGTDNRQVKGSFMFTVVGENTAD